MSPDGRSLIDDEILRAAQAEKPKVCFVPTAMGDSITGIQRFEDSFAGRADASVLSLFCQEPWGYRDPQMLLDQDVIYVGGGSTANLLALWRLHGLPEVLREASSRGTILAGISAGANCWFEASSTDSFGALAPLRDGLGFLNGSFCPHYLDEDSRRPCFQQWIAEGELPAGYAADDFCALRFEDGKFMEAIAEREDRPFAVVGSRGEEVHAPRLLKDQPTGA